MEMTRKQFFKSFVGGIVGLGSIAVGVESAKAKTQEPVTIYAGGQEPVGSVYHTPNKSFIKFGKGEHDWKPLPAPTPHKDILQIVKEARNNMREITG